MAACGLWAITVMVNLATAQLRGGIRPSKSCLVELLRLRQDAATVSFLRAMAACGPWARIITSSLATAQRPIATLPYPWRQMDCPRQISRARMTPREAHWDYNLRKV